MATGASTGTIWRKTFAALRPISSCLLSCSQPSTSGLALASFSVRYRFYTRNGVSVEELTRLAFSYSVTFCLGLLALGGVSFLVSPPAFAQRLATPGLIRVLGSCLLLIPLGFVAVTAVVRTPFRFRHFEVPLPSPRLAILQLVLSCVEWTLYGAVLSSVAGAVLLMPAQGLSRRLDAAYYLVVVTLIGGVAASLLKGSCSASPG
jgi:uncharacterized membrane protein YbhN (UPF0104 family)